MTEACSCPLNRCLADEMNDRLQTSVSQSPRPAGCWRAPPAWLRARLVRIHLNRGGYAAGGQYWGAGEPLYRAVLELPEGDDDTVMRARGRVEAKELARDWWYSRKIWFYGEPRPPEEKTDG